MRVFDLCGSRALMLSALLLAAGPAPAFEDPSDVPASKSERMLASPMSAITQVGDRTIAVGQRGHIAVSDDGGKTWRQAAVPVSSDLVAVSFPSERYGWAVGHGGVVLHSRDGGETWEKQLDGKEASRLVLDYFGESGPGSTLPDAAMYLEREQILISYGGTQPLMAVHFVDEQVGYVGGLFNRLFRTRNGGKTWEPWQHRIDNPGELHFYSMTADDQALYITGEQGRVWRMRQGEERFAEKPTGYDGTLFGAISNGRTLLAFGMRGSLFRSEDAGDSWSRVEAQTQAGITSGAFLADGTLLLGSLSGEVARSTDEGRTFQALKLSKSMPLFGLSVTQAGQVTLVGAAGVHHEVVTLERNKDSDSSALVKNAGVVGKGTQWETGHGYAN